MRNKCVLQINTVINSGSTGRIAEEIGQKILDLGWESYIAYGRNDRPSKSQKIKIGTPYSIMVHGIETRLFDRHGFASKNATRELVKRIEEIKPDIIHLHNLHGYYLNIEILFKYLEVIKKPIVWTLHDCWPITGHCTHFTFVNCNKWQQQCHHCPQKKEYPASFFGDQSFVNHNQKKQLFTSVNNMTIVAVSAWMERIIKKSYLGIFPILKIHNGIDLEVFKPIAGEKTLQIQKLENKFIILGLASVWNTKKGLYDFIKLNEFLKEGEIIILVGLSESQIKQLPKNMVGISRTENVEQLAELYSSADVFINLTWEDNFPTTNLEALACGTPVITYNTGGCPEAVTPETGFIVKQGDLCNIRNLIDTIKQKSKSYYSPACRQRAVDYFNKEERYNEYINIYKSLV